METRNILDQNGNVIGTLSYPTGTDESVWDAALAPYAMTLSQAIANNIANAQVQLELFMDSRYSIRTRLSLNAIYNLSVQAGMTNRESYIAQMFTWGQAIVAYAASYIATVSSMTNVSTVLATSPNFSAFLPGGAHADPMVTPIAAVQISN